MKEFSHVSKLFWGLSLCCPDRPKEKHLNQIQKDLQLHFRYRGWQKTATKNQNLAKKRRRKNASFKSLWNLNYSLIKRYGRRQMPLYYRIKPKGGISELGGWRNWLICRACFTFPLKIAKITLRTLLMVFISWKTSQNLNLKL